LACALIFSLLVTRAARFSLSLHQSTGRATREKPGEAAFHPVDASGCGHHSAVSRCTATQSLRRDPRRTRNLSRFGRRVPPGACPRRSGIGLDGKSREDGYWRARQHPRYGRPRHTRENEPLRGFREQPANYAALSLKGYRNLCSCCTEPRPAHHDGSVPTESISHPVLAPAVQ
jgi:hypothetical protein